MIRQAKSNEFEQVYPLLMMASASVINTFSTQEDQVYQIMKQFYCENTKFNFKNIFVFEKEEKIVAAMVLFNSIYETEYSKKQKEIIKLKYDLDIEIENEGDNKNFYLDSLAVCESAQKQGIASQMLLFAKEYTKNNLTLLVENSKPQLIKYYAKYGFKVVGDVILCNLEFTRMSL